MKTSKTKYIFKVFKHEKFRKIHPKCNSKTRLLKNIIYKNIHIYVSERQRQIQRLRESKAFILMTSFTQLWKLASLKFVKLAGKREIQGRADNTA